MADVDAAAVRRDLHASLVAHNASLTARRRGDYGGARDHLADAATYRQMAHERDPEHTAPAWAEEQRLSPRGKDTHAELVAFYTAKGVWGGG